MRCGDCHTNKPRAGLCIQCADRIKKQLEKLKSNIEYCIASVEWVDSGRPDNLAEELDLIEYTDGPIVELIVKMINEREEARERVQKLEEQLRGLIKASDIEWREQNPGWKEAVSAACNILNPSHLDVDQ